MRLMGCAECVDLREDIWVGESETKEFLCGEQQNISSHQRRSPSAMLS